MDKSPQADSVEREPVEITWFQNRPGQFQVIYQGAPLEQWPGDRDKAKVLAKTLGFTLVTNEDHRARWVRQSPGSASQATTQGLSVPLGADAGDRDPASRCDSL